MAIRAGAEATITGGSVVSDNTAEDVRTVTHHPPSPLPPPLRTHARTRTHHSLPLPTHPLHSLSPWRSRAAAASTSTKQLSQSAATPRSRATTQDGYVSQPYLTHTPTHPASSPRSSTPTHPPPIDPRPINVLPTPPPLRVPRHPPTPSLPHPHGGPVRWRRLRPARDAHH